MRGQPRKHPPAAQLEATRLLVIRRCSNTPTGLDHSTLGSVSELRTPLRDERGRDRTRSKSRSLPTIHRTSSTGEPKRVTPRPSYSAEVVSVRQARIRKSAATRSQAQRMLDDE